jgi:XTP/dITP diphosphohydrolase
MPAPLQIIVATGNPGKLKEMQRVLGHLDHIELLSLREFPDYEALPEGGDSLEEISQVKAQHAADSLGYWALADDSGLFVPALGGEPGIYSARYAGVGASDADNRTKLLQAMQGLDGMARRAYFACAISLAKPKEMLQCIVGRCEGHLLEEERGSNGFGYDSLFVKDDYDKTFAQLGADIKDRISHRGKALEKMAMVLEGLTA